MNAQSVEYTVKATFIEKFAHFTEWKTKPSGDYFVIAVIGKSPFNGELENITQKVKLKNKPIKINYIQESTEAKNCDLLFICSSEKNKLQNILHQVENQNILIISDTPGFAQKGVHFNFYIDDTFKVKYEVNLTALKKTSLIIDMQLLNYGKIIR